MADASDLSQARTESETSPCLADPLEEAIRLIDAGTRAGIPLRATGGLGIALICPSARRPPLARSYQDLDFMAPSRKPREIGQLLTEISYVPEEALNTLHRQRRLFFLDQVHHRQADVFLDRIEMCHNLDLRDRATVLDRT